MNQTNLFPDNPSWKSAEEYFTKNGTESKLDRVPSPDKITTPRILYLLH